jgi:hypothetical protein
LYCQNPFITAPVPPLACTCTASASPLLPEMTPHSPPPYSLPTHPSVSPPHRTGRTALMPPPPTTQSPSPSGHPAPPRPYKRARSSPLLTALILTPHFPLSAPLVAPHRASPPPFALHCRRPRLAIESATEALGEDPRSSSPFSPTRGELPGSAASASHAPMSAPPCPGRESTVDRPTLRGPQPVDSVHHFSIVKINQNSD